MQNSKRVPMGAFSETKLRISKLKDGESIIFNDPKREMKICERRKELENIIINDYKLEIKLYKFKKKIFRNYREIINEFNKGNSYKEFLNLVNFYIREGYFINSFIEYKISEIIKSSELLKYKEKLYLIVKIEAFKDEYLNRVSKDDFNIFKFSKYIITHENIKHSLYIIGYNIATYDDETYNKKIKRIKHYCNNNILV